MTNYQQEEIETILSIIHRKKDELNDHIESINTAIANNAEPMTVSTSARKSIEVIECITTSIDILEHLNKDRK